VKVDLLFAARVAELAAEIVCDGFPYGTFEDPEAHLVAGVGVESALMRAAYATWGGPGWWRLNMTRATQCLQSIRWLVCDDIPADAFPEKESRALWATLNIDETALMLLFAGQALRTKASQRATAKRAAKQLT
jgi:hypothetical protein